MVQANCLTLNVSKANYMVFRNKSMPLNTDKCRILIENEELQDYYSKVRRLNELVYNKNNNNNNINNGGI